MLTRPKVTHYIRSIYFPTRIRGFEIYVSASIYAHRKPKKLKRYNECNGKLPYILV